MVKWGCRAISQKGSVSKERKKRLGYKGKSIPATSWPDTDQFEICVAVSRKEPEAVIF